MDERTSRDATLTEEQADRLRRILEISKAYVEAMTGPPICLEEFLYDEHGLPK